MALPFPDASFDVAAVAFGMRNMPDKLRVLREMARVTAPGGQVMILEMTFAPRPLFRPLYGFYLGRLLRFEPEVVARLRRLALPHDAPDAGQHGLLVQLDPGQPFVDAYLKFVTDMRGRYPDAMVYLATSPMLADPQHTQQRAYLQAVIDARADVQRAAYERAVPKRGPLRARVDALPA